VEEIRSTLSQAGVDSKPYSGHSFRSGAATTAARQGVGDATIKMLGRWKSSAYQLYVQTPREQLAAISRKLSPSEPQEED
jgi:site-specific recombinase XerD